jgi:predicted adenine nucleotide alpha hydrolase (AANH) superfamily ATPase
LLADSYEHERWLSRVKGLENEPEKGKRCTECFRFNLENSARKAEELGIEKYTTTLSISPHKNSSQIFESSPDSDSFKSVFAGYDFKKGGGFARSMELSKELGLYRQKYCGCEFSLKDSGRKV